MFYQQLNFVGNTYTSSPSTLGDSPFHLRSFYSNFCSISIHHPGQCEHYGKDHGSYPRRLYLIYAAVKVTKKGYKMWHLAVQGEWIAVGQLTVAQVLAKAVKL